MKKTILVEISGTDAPGITAKVATCIEEFQGKLLDIEQAVTQLLLSLMMVVELEDKSVTAFEIAVRDRLKDSKLELNFSAIGEITRFSDTADRFVVTLLAQEIPIAFWGELTRTLAQMQINLDSIKKLSSKDLSTIEFIASSANKINFIANLIHGSKMPEMFFSSFFIPTRIINQALHKQFAPLNQINHSTLVVAYQRNRSHTADSNGI